MREAKRRAPKDTGTLSRSIVMETHVEAGLPVVYVGSSLSYALFVHEGTGIYSKTNPGFIYPRSAQALRWPRINNSGSGRRRYRGGATSSYVFARRVKGTPGRPFLRDALPKAYD
jgi:hypothetical protein